MSADVFFGTIEAIFTEPIVRYYRPAWRMDEKAFGEYRDFLSTSLSVSFRP